MRSSDRPPTPPGPAGRPGPPGSALAAFDRWQRERAAVAFPVAVVRKFLDDRASSLAALVAYYAFLSLFPLLLVLVSLLGFALEDDPALQEEVLDSALARIPVVGAQLGDDVEPLTGSTAALAIGLAGALWAGLGVTVALLRAFENIWDVPRVDQRSGLRARARGLLVLLVLGVGAPRRDGDRRAWPSAGARAGGRAPGRDRPDARRQRGGVPRRLRRAHRAAGARPGALPGVLIAAVGSLALQTPAAGTSSAR